MGFTRLVDAPVEQTQALLAGRAIPALASIRWRRGVEMRLEAAAWWPRRGSVTLIEMLPVGEVTPSPAYFDAGNRYLDELVAELRAQAPRLEVAPAA